MKMDLTVPGLICDWLLIHFPFLDDNSMLVPVVLFALTINLACEGYTVYNFTAVSLNSFFLMLLVRTELGFGRRVGS